MSDFIPINDLDKAILAMNRSTAAMPDLFRCLRAVNLYLLVPFHPEIPNHYTMELKNGMPMPFIRFKTEHGVAIAAYSSEARVQEGLKKNKFASQRWMSAMMPAVQAMEIVGKMKMKLIINHGCATGALTLPPRTLCDVASGAALQTLGMGGDHTEQLTLDKLDPADYPTDLLQPLFELFRKHRNFRAAWVFTRTIAGQPAPEYKPYYLMLYMEPRDATLFHDFNLVAQAARGKHELNLSLVPDEGPEALANLFKQAQPFYVAADYVPPGQA